jgi:starch phosphorylase
LTERLVQGVDVWLNTPRRPWEACGTSGMKVLANGGLNVSELDGWWAEAYTSEVGWAIGDGLEHDADSAWDAAEAETLYTLLEQEVIPEFYARDSQGIPTRWLARMRESMALLTPQYSANRAVREYTEEHYLPAAAAYAERARDGAALARWREDLDRHWSSLRFGALRVEGTSFEVEVYLGDLDANAVAVELYAEGAGDPFRQSMDRGERLPGSPNAYLYRASVPSGRPAGDYTPRVVPFHEKAAVPLEAAHILWQR